MDGPEVPGSLENTRPAPMHGRPRPPGGPEICRLMPSSATGSCESPLPTDRPLREALAKPLVGGGAGRPKENPTHSASSPGPRGLVPALSTPRRDTCSSPRLSPRPSLQWNPGSGPGRGRVSCGVRLGGRGLTYPHPHWPRGLGFSSGGKGVPAEMLIVLGLKDLESTMQTNSQEGRGRTHACVCSTQHGPHASRSSLHA